MAPGKKKTKTRPFTPKQKRFPVEYVVDWNATKAAERSGYSKKTAGSIGHALLKNVEIQKAIGQEAKKALNRAEITVDRVLQEEKAIAFFDIRDLFDDEGGLRPISDLPEAAARAVSSIQVEEKSWTPQGGDNPILSTTYKYRMNDKGRSLERIGKYLKMYIDRVQIEASSDLIAALNRVEKTTGIIPTEDG